jgi:AcrR family transcriptional regulator
MAETRPRDRDATEKALVNAGRHLIETMGYETIRTRDVSAHVDCNHGLITLYFGNKLGLFTQVLHQMGLEIQEAIHAGSTTSTIIGTPLMTAYWRLLAALLAGGMDPAIALNEGSPVVNSMVARAEMLSGQDLSQSRAIAAQAILLIGGYHVFGEALMTELSPSQDHEGSIVGLQHTMMKLMQIESIRK